MYYQIHTVFEDGHAKHNPYQVMCEQFVGLTAQDFLVGKTNDLVASVGYNPNYPNMTLSEAIKGLQDCEIASGNYWEQTYNIKSYPNAVTCSYDYVNNTTTWHFTWSENGLPDRIGVEPAIMVVCADSQGLILSTIFEWYSNGTLTKRVENKLDSNSNAIIQCTFDPLTSTSEQLVLNLVED